MKKLLTMAGVAAMALGLGACAYDPYPSSGNTRTAVSVGYGHGFGYGGSSFSTSFFWSTGDPRWSYDPYVRAYFCNHRRAYYDPFLYGFYPVGFRPPILVGVPHPVGYRQGWCPPPRNVTNVTIVNYRNRESAYRQTNHRWAQNVRQDRTQRYPQASQQTQSRQQPQGRPSSSRNDGNRWDGRNAPSRGSVAPLNDRTLRGGSLDNRGPNRGSLATPPPSRQPQPQRGNLTREPVSAGTPARGREAFGGDPRQQQGRPSAAPAPQRERMAPRDSRPVDPGFSNRGSRQAPQSAPASAPRVREQAARPQQRDAGFSRPAPQTRPSPNAGGGNPGRGGDNRGGRGGR